MDLTICSSSTAADRSSFTATRPDSPSHPSGNWRASSAKRPLEPVCSTDRVCVICIVLHLVVLRGAAVVLHLMLREHVRSCRGKVKVMTSQGSRLGPGAVAVAVVEPRHVSAPAPGRTWLLGVEPVWAF